MPGGYRGQSGEDAGKVKFGLQHAQVGKSGLAKAVRPTRPETVGLRGVFRAVSQWTDHASAFMLIFAIRDPQTIGVSVLGDPSAENILRLLDTGHAVYDHLPVELIKIGDLETRSASTGRRMPLLALIRIGLFTRVKRQGRAV